MNTVIIHYDEEGFMTCRACGPDVRVFCVDERSKNDRVYEFEDRVPEEDIKALLGDSDIGHRDDERFHPAQLRRMACALEGKPHLSVVEDEG